MEVYLENTGFAGGAGSPYLVIFRRLIILSETVYTLEVGKTRGRFFLMRGGGDKMQFY